MALVQPYWREHMIFVTFYNRNRLQYSLRHFKRSIISNRMQGTKHQWYALARYMDKIVFMRTRILYQVRILRALGLRGAKRFKLFIFWCCEVFSIFLTLFRIHCAAMRFLEWSYTVSTMVFHILKYTSGVLSWNILLMYYLEIHFWCIILKYTSDVLPWNILLISYLEIYLWYLILKYTSNVLSWNILLTDVLSWNILLVITAMLLRLLSCNTSTIRKL